MLRSSVCLQQCNCLMDGPLQMYLFGGAPSLLIQVGVADKQLESPHSSVFPWVDLDDLCQLPLVPWHSIIFQQNDIIDLGVSV